MYLLLQIISIFAFSELIKFHGKERIRVRCFAKVRKYNTWCDCRKVPSEHTSGIYVTRVLLGCVQAFQLTVLFRPCCSRSIRRNMTERSSNSCQPDSIVTFFYLSTSPFQVHPVRSAIIEMSFGLNLTSYCCKKLRFLFCWWKKH